MSRLWIVILALALLVGCGGDEEAKTEAEAVVETEAAGEEMATMPETDGQLCQSCAMPLIADHLHGSEADGSPSEDYCSLCYQRGQFIQPDMGVDQMIDLVSEKMAAQGDFTEIEARALMAKTIPTLKRWSRARRAGSACSSISIWPISIR